MGHFVLYKNSKVHYSTYGHGAALLICLHGFGEEAASFSFLEKAIGHSFTLIAINMPFHGETVWNEGLLFTPEDLHEIIISLVQTCRPQPIPEKINFLAYSMGGRLALAYFQQYPQLVKSISLVAPDGLHKNRWYWFATQTSAGNRLFKFTMQQPQYFLGMVKILGKINLLNKSVAKFVACYLEDETIRTALYKRWTTMRRFRPNLPLIQQLIRQNKIPTKMLFGEHDRIILYHRGQKFQRGLEEWVGVKTIKAGHQLLQEKYTGEIIELLDGHFRLSL